MKRAITLSALIKQLQKLEAAGHGRAKVAVDKESFWDGNGTFQICDVTGARASVVNLSDGYGFIEVDSRGQEKCRRMIVLDGIFPQAK